MTEFVPTAEQSAVLSAVEAWLADPSGPQWRYLAGSAGTGKTSLARLLAQGRRVAYCAFTGKAASVLREKGCEGATTLHRTIYRPQETAVKSADGEQRWSTEFVARDDDPLRGVDLVILDECSMADSKMAVDLLSYGKRVLVLGDPFQLPPVSGEGYFTRHEHQWFLREVHRQALESGILRLATDIREGRGVLDPASYMPECGVVSFDEATASEDELLAWCDQVIVGTHRMRQHFNKTLREARGRRSAFPEPGDRLVCMANDHRLGLLNGAIWTCESPARQVGHHRLEMMVRSEDDSSQRLLVEAWDHDFLGVEGELLKLPWNRRAERARFAYGYALTAHKAQGSEYENVVVIDESAVFREHPAQWLYTACTRASKRLVLVRP